MMRTPSYKPGDRSSTAVQGVVDKRDENIYSSIVVQDGASGAQSFFTVPKGQRIPTLKGATVQEPQRAWHQVHADHSTNIEKAGELGDGIGDALIRGLAMSAEQAEINPATGALPLSGALTWGATDFELSQIAYRSAIELKISKKPMFKTPFHTLPAFGAVVGALQWHEAVNTSGTRSLASNGGGYGQVRRLMNYVAASRRDTVEVSLTLANSTTLGFRVAGAAANDGTPFLVTCVLPALIQGDAR